jgi:hypothetical protein
MKKESKVLGRVFEKLTASMYSEPGVKVERNVHLPGRPAGGKATGGREIDVLLTGHMAGMVIRVPIECKDYSKRVGVEKIDAFIGKLAHVGLPAQGSVFVAAHGFTKGALARAAEAGVITRVLKEVTKEGLASMVNTALQRVVYLLAMVDTISFQDNVPQHDDLMAAYWFYDKDKHFCGTIMDLIWRKWRAGEPPSRIGEHDITLEVPAGWHRIVGGKEEPLLSLTVKIQVVGLVALLPGTATRLVLSDGTTGATEKTQVNVAFEGRSYAVRAVDSEEELNQSSEAAAFRITVGRFRLPRILMGFMYWPPSAKALEKFNHLAAMMPPEEFLKLPLSMHNIEEQPLAAAWDPIIDGWPVDRA